MLELAKKGRTGQLRRKEKQQVCMDVVEHQREKQKYKAKWKETSQQDIIAKYTDSSISSP
jgi:hypothetical protein